MVMSEIQHHPRIKAHHPKLGWPKRGESCCQHTSKYLVSSVVTALNSDTAVCVVPLLDSFESSSRHSSLKSLLPDTFSLSKGKYTQQFFYLNDLGNRQPSEIMDFMIRLHAGKMPEFLLKFAFK